MHGGCRVNPASLLATVGTSNARYVSRVREATECGHARRLAVAVGDFHTAQPLPDSLRPTQQRAAKGAGAAGLLLFPKKEARPPLPLALPRERLPLHPPGAPP